MSTLPEVKNELEMKVLNHVFHFRRLTWKDMPPVSEWVEKHKMADRLAITAHALYDISGKDVTPEEALKVLTSIPRGALETVYKFYKGSLDPHRMFEVSPWWKAPDAATYRQELDEEGAETDEKMDEVEELLTQKFGRQAVEEEKALAQKIVAGTGYAGALKMEEDFMLKAKQSRVDKEEWQ
jgi:hypothetical protein